MAQVTYAIELIPENAGKIDAINRIILGESYTAEAPATTGRGMVEEIEKSKAKSEAKTEPKAKAEPKKESKAGTASKVTFDTFKAAAKKAKADHGEDFVKEMIEQAGAELESTLLKSVSAVDAELRQEIMDLWVAGPTEQAADEPEDDLDDDLDDDLEDDLEDDGLDDDEADIDPEAVKTALKAYSKSEGREAAKEIMTKNGAAALSKVNDCSQKQLAAMMKELV